MGRFANAPTESLSVTVALPTVTNFTRRTAASGRQGDAVPKISLRPDPPYFGLLSLLLELVQDQGDEGGVGVIEPVEDGGIAVASNDAVQDGGEGCPVRVGGQLVE